MIFPTPYLLAGALAVGLLTGWTANGWRLNGKIDAMVLEHTHDYIAVAYVIITQFQSGIH